VEVSAKVVAQWCRNHNQIPPDYLTTPSTHSSGI
jgi:hypothetical protein